jgi:predicted nucleic acid-binding protein
MSGVNNVLVDTNIIIYGIGGSFKIRRLLEKRTLFISIITEMELLGNNFKTTNEELLTKDFVSNCFVLNIDNSIKEKAIAIRKRHKLTLPDAIIAATSMVQRLPLITSDRDFERVQIPNIQFVTL